MTRSKTTRGGARFGGGPRGPRKGAPGSGRPRVSPEARAAVLGHMAGGGTLSGAAVVAGVCRLTAQRIAKAAGVVCRSGRPAKVRREGSEVAKIETLLPDSANPID